MAKQKNQSEMAAKKRARKAALKEGVLLDVATVGTAPKTKQKPIELPSTIFRSGLTSKEENENKTAEDVKLGMMKYNELLENKDNFIFNCYHSKDILAQIKVGLENYDFAHLKVVQDTMAQHISDKAFREIDAKRCMSIYSALCFVNGAFIGGTMRWWIARNHFKVNFNMDINTNVPGHPKFTGAKVYRISGK